MKPIAFFCAEYGVEERLHLYAGGLGILSGDFVREAGDLNVPLIAIGLFYNAGEAEKHPDVPQEKHVLEAHGFQRVRDTDGKILLVEVDDTTHGTIRVQAWTRTYGSARLYLLDTNVQENPPEFRTITSQLYDANFNNEMLEEFILGVGGIKLLRALNIEPGVYHLNEGHTSFVALSLAAEYLHDHPEESSFTAALDAVRHKIVATKHTILSGAGLYIEKEQLRSMIGSYITRHRIDFEELFAMGNHADAPNVFSTTKFLLRSAIRSNAVSMLHAIFEKQKHPNSPLIAITNGVYAPQWRSIIWPKDGIGILSDSEIWEKRNELRKNMINFVKERTGIELNPDALTVVWARRFASYKRPHLLFNDLERLKKIISDATQPVQFIISGNAHEADEAGKATIEKIKAYIEEAPLKGKVVYVPHYSISVSKELAKGADIWLNTPERGVEACGTSGMKASLNGALQCSVSDGWIEEVDWTNAGWVLSQQDTEHSMYDTLEKEIKPMFYDRNKEGLPEQWLKRVRTTIGIVSSRFTAERMVKDYVSKLYYPET